MHNPAQPYRTGKKPGSPSREQYRSVIFTHTEQQTREARELIAAQREGRKLGLDIVGFYHSHPDHPAHWSQTDFAEAHWFGCAYLITAVNGDKQTGRAAATNSFVLTGTGEEDKAFATQLISLTSD